MTQHGDETAGRRSDVAELHLASEEPEPLLHGGALAHDSLTDDADPEELPVDRNQAILRAAKRTGALLKQTGHPFALAGSVAVYAHGGTQNLQHDVDFCIRPEDAEAVAEALRAAGLPVRRPPEDWLLKATCLGQQVDLIFELAHQPVTTELLGRAQNLSVDSVHMPVLAPTDLMRSLMAAFSEHHCDFGAVLPIARTLREKIDWDDVRRTCAGTPMPDAFLYFLERLDVIPPQPREEVPR
ncbi:putative nucleotidyltransferase-like protein [Streptomyces sp. TLI_55]|uniref:nucleotidyltransferase family protein n=1 Tax=Streptomyces sp. TLI_55 TaxID=1938861 RepID=UPI000BC6212E|nr:nucleotidyltransferase family protein [Streptomyces sp. TLI_55]SNX65898.1 putative nucleotidyltransferase-like protein [Streptomyces sp. TLI_55]